MNYPEIKLLVPTEYAKQALKELDRSFLGSPNYMGYVSFWHTDYNGWLSNCTTHQKKSVHDRFIQLRLSLDGRSDQHLEVLEELC
mgnify:CR=1 FL=1